MLPYLRFHHIGIATFDIETTGSEYQHAGYAKSPTVSDPVQDVKICFLEKPGMPRLELLEPADGNSPVTKILRGNGVTPYHMCYEADDLGQAVSDLKKRRFLVVAKPVEAVAMGGRRVCFLYHKTVGLVELVESEKIMR